MHGERASRTNWVVVICLVDRPARDPVVQELYAMSACNALQH